MFCHGVPSLLRFRGERRKLAVGGIDDQRGPVRQRSSLKPEFVVRDDLARSFGRAIRVQSLSDLPGEYRLVPPPSERSCRTVRLVVRMALWSCWTRFPEDPDRPTASVGASRFSSSPAPLARRHSDQQGRPATAIRLQLQPLTRRRHRQIPFSFDAPFPLACLTDHSRGTRRAVSPSRAIELLEPRCAGPIARLTC